MIIGGPALTKYNDRALRNLTTAPASATSSPGALVHIKTLTASSSATLSFVDGASSVVLDSTYPIYKFEFINMHPATDDATLQFNLSVDTGSNYNVTKTTTAFGAANSESGGTPNLNYDTGLDLAQSTNFQGLNLGSSDNDHAISGTLQLFNPSSTTFVKHFIAISDTTNYDNRNLVKYIAGYGNTTSAVDAIQFKFSSGNVDSGTIKLYGVKDA